MPYGHGLCSGEASRSSPGVSMSRALGLCQLSTEIAVGCGISTLTKLLYSALAHL